MNPHRSRMQDGYSAPLKTSHGTVEQRTSRSFGKPGEEVVHCISATLRGGVERNERKGLFLRLKITPQSRPCGAGLHHRHRLQDDAGDGRGPAVPEELDPLEQIDKVSHVLSRKRILLVHLPPPRNQIDKPFSYLQTHGGNLLVNGKHPVRHDSFIPSQP